VAHYLTATRASVDTFAAFSPSTPPSTSWPATTFRRRWCGLPRTAPAWPSTVWSPGGSRPSLPGNGAGLRGTRTSTADRLPRPYNAAAMLGRLRWLKRLLVDLPRHVKLAYCLLLDPRVPARRKALVGAALAALALPAVDLPLAVPLVGELDALAVTLALLRLLERSAPPEVVAEHELLIRQGRSRFDQDVERSRRLAAGLASRLRALEHLGREHDDSLRRAA
jgi:uncharacterized membrane protein YkvA (DUF1232 family)